MKVRDAVAATGALLDQSIAVMSIAAEDEIRRRLGVSDMDRPPQTYRRYGYGLSNLVAHKFVESYVADFACDLDVIPVGRLFNSGMSAITTCIEALSLDASDTIFYHRDCYFATAEYMKILESRGVGVRAIDMASGTVIHDLVAHRSMGRKIVFAESFANHHRMIRAPLEEFAATMRSGDFFMLDNSLIGASQLDPRVFLGNRCNTIYIESLTKYYHSDESSRVSAGIALFPECLRQAVDNTIAIFGTYLQLNDLLELPFSMYETGAQRVKRIAKTCRMFCAAAAEAIKARSLPIRISMPLVGEQEQTAWPGVVFLVLGPTSRSTSRDLAERLITSLQLPDRGSFGHRFSSILPIGLRWEDAEDGLIRIAFGSDDSAEVLTERFRQFLDQNY